MQVRVKEKPFDDLTVADMAFDDTQKIQVLARSPGPLLGILRGDKERKGS